MSITTAQRARLGIFMTGGLVLFLFFIIIPVGFKIVDRQKFYYGYFEGESLSGLEQGAAVKFRGIPIGKVSKITYNARNLERVKVHLQIDAQFPVMSDMSLQTGMVGITGLKYVEMMGGTDTTAIVLDEHTIIETKQSLMAALSGKTEVIIAKIELLLNNVNKALSDENIGKISTILAHVEGMSKNADIFMSSVTPDVKNITRSAKNTMNTIDSIANDIQILTKGISKNVNFASVAKILVEIDSTAIALKKLSINMDLTVQQSREDVSVSMQNLREALENINELSNKLLENPSLILRGEQQKARRIK